MKDVKNLNPCGREVQPGCQDTTSGVGFIGLKDHFKISASDSLWDFAAELEVA